MHTFDSTFESVSLSGAHDDPADHFYVGSALRFELPAAPVPTGEDGEAYWDALDAMRGNDRGWVEEDSSSQRDFSITERAEVALVLSGEGLEYIEPALLDDPHAARRAAKGLADRERAQLLEGAVAPEDEEAAMRFLDGITGSGLDERHRSELDTTDDTRHFEDAWADSLDRIGARFDDDAALLAAQKRAEAAHVVTIGVGGWAQDVRRELAPAIESGAAQLTRDALGVPALALRGPGAGVAAVLLGDPYADTLCAARACDALLRSWERPRRTRYQLWMSVPACWPVLLLRALMRRGYKRWVQARARAAAAPLPRPEDPAYLAWHDAVDTVAELIESRESRGFELAGWTTQPLTDPKASELGVERALAAGLVTARPVFVRPEPPYGIQHRRKDGTLSRRRTFARLKPPFAAAMPLERRPSLAAALARAVERLPRPESLPAPGPAPVRRITLTPQLGPTEEERSRRYVQLLDGERKARACWLRQELVVWNFQRTRSKTTPEQAERVRQALLAQIIAA